MICDPFFVQRLSIYSLRCKLTAYIKPLTCVFWFEFDLQHIVRICREKCFYETLHEISQVHNLVKAHRACMGSNTGEMIPPTSIMVSRNTLWTKWRPRKHNKWLVIIFSLAFSALDLWILSNDNLHKYLTWLVIATSIWLVNALYLDLWILSNLP
jgi:hypothetical protein